MNAKESYENSNYSVYSSGITVNEMYVNMRAGVLPDFKSSYEKYSAGFEKDVENFISKMFSLG